MIRSKGFTLVEALIAILVLSIGLLGVAAMQLKALQSAHAGYQRSIASLAAQDAAELMWSTLEPKELNCPDVSGWDRGEENWHSRWGKFLPGLDDASNPVQRDPSSSECEYLVIIEWSKGRFKDEEVSSLNYRIRLPRL